MLIIEFGVKQVSYRIGKMTSSRKRTWGKTFCKTRNKHLIIGLVLLCFNSYIQRTGSLRCLHLIKSQDEKTPDTALKPQPATTLHLTGQNMPLRENQSSERALGARWRRQSTTLLKPALKYCTLHKRLVKIFVKPSSSESPRARMPLSRRSFEYFMQTSVPCGMVCLLYYGCKRAGDRSPDILVTGFHEPSKSDFHLEAGLIRRSQLSPPTNA